MSGPTSAQRGPGRQAPTHPQLPPGLRVAGTGVRLGAWLLDSIVIGLIGGGLGAILVPAGGLRLNPDALAQMREFPGIAPSVPLYQVDSGAVAVVAFVSLLVMLGYSTACWHLFRGLPGQRLLSIQVGDATTGKTLTLGRSLVRSIVLYGLTGASGGVVAVAFSAMLGTVSWADLASGAGSATLDAWSGSWGLPLMATALFSITWPVILLIATVSDPHRQGLHDRMAGSLVVARAPQPTYWPAPAASAGAAPADTARPSGYVPPAAVDNGPFAPGHSPATSDRPPDPRGEEPGPADQPPSDGPTPPYAPPAGWPASDSGSPTDRLWLHDDSQDKPQRNQAAVAIGRRVGAYFLDCALVYMAFSLILTIMSTGTDRTQSWSEKAAIIAGLLGGLEQAVYFIGGWLAMRGTLGQRVFHLEVNYATTGKRLGPQDAFIRWTVMQGPFAAATIAPEAARVLILSLAAGWACFLLYSTLSSSDGRGIHDRLVNSAVTQDY